MPYLTCTREGCIASQLMKDDTLRQFENGRRMKVGFWPLGSEKVVVIEVALDGLDKPLGVL